MKFDEFSEQAMAAKAEFAKAMAVECPTCGEPNHPIVMQCVGCGTVMQGPCRAVRVAEKTLTERLVALGMPVERVYGPVERAPEDAALVNARQQRDHAAEEARHYRLLWETVSACLREIAPHVYREIGTLGYLGLECAICGAYFYVEKRAKLDWRKVPHELGCVMHKVDTLLYEPSKNTTPDAEERR